MKTLLITAQTLAHHGACLSSRYRMQDLFPHGVVPTEELVRKYVGNFSWSWAILLLLKGEHLAAAQAEEEVIEQAREKLCNNAYEAYDASIDDNRYRVLCDTLDELYRDSHLQLALIFLRHFQAQGGLPIREDTPS